MILLVAVAQAALAQSTSPVPLLASGTPVDWWFVFKFNAQNFPACGGPARSCIFGGSPASYSTYGQQFVYSSSENHVLRKGSDCLGDSVGDPVGATYSEAYKSYHYFVVWNDQFYNDPKVACESNGECSGPWGHSKGMLVWDKSGNGFVMQVTTPSWPGAGTSRNPRSSDGNTLGCVKDNNLLYSQHFFALKLTEADVLAMLAALQNASVVTDPTNKQIVHNGGPAAIKKAVTQLGYLSKSTTPTNTVLSSGVRLISKPSKLNVPPWQMVSSLLGGVPLRTATWWASPFMPPTTSSTPIGCWSQSLTAKPAGVDIARYGNWDGTTLGLEGGSSKSGDPDYDTADGANHAKVGVSVGSDLTIFGDLNQQGYLNPTDPGYTGKDTNLCDNSQSGRGGTFFVVEDQSLHDSVAALIQGESAP